MKRISRYYFVFLFVCAGFAVGAIAIAVGVTMAADNNLRHQIGLEMAKTGIHLILLTIIGGAVAQALKHIEAAREERRVLNQERLTLLGDILSSYNRIKAARRILRAIGLRPGSNEALPREQISEFTAQMKALNEAQLSLEKVAREIKPNQRLFESARNRDEVNDNVNKVAKYVNKIIEEWEGPGCVICDRSKYQEFKELLFFVDEAKISFGPNAAEPLERIEEIIRKELSK